jgi:hypothetical protein
MQKDRRTRHGRYFAFVFGVLLVLHGEGRRCEGAGPRPAHLPDQG